MAGVTAALIHARRCGAPQFLCIGGYMTRRTRWTVAVLMMAVTLAAATTSASANRLASSSSVFGLIWSRLTLQPSLGSSVICPVTMVGTLHGRTITKTLASLVGYVTSADVGTAGSTTAVCEGGTLTVLIGTLPWHARYRAFTGSLPNISGVIPTFTGVSMQFNNGPLTCLFRTTPERPFVGTLNRESGGGITSFTADSSASIPAPIGGGLCALATVRFLGTANVGGSGGAVITVTLI